MNTSASEPLIARSRDGTAIAYWASGHGRPVVLVHGAGSTRTTWNAVLPYLEPHLAVHVLDRRGRGASGDGSEYELMREYEDVAVVVDQISHAARAPVDVIGHSFGGACALGAAQLTTNIRRLVLYESWADHPKFATESAELAGGLEVLLAEGRGDAALEAFYLWAGLTQAELHEFQRIPGWWDARLALAHTIPREVRAPIPWPLDPAAERPGAPIVNLPTLLILGGDSSPHVQAVGRSIASTLPDARVAIVPGQGHVAHLSAPADFAEVLLAFVR